MARRLYVGNLSYQATEAELKELFGQAGAVASVKIITDAYTGQSRGFGFVEMGTDEEAQKAISLFNGHALKNRQLVVNEARPPQRDRGFGPGRGGHDRGGRF